ncbi:MerR family transcriptional regulator [Oceanomicrobium pacificus]|uniref:Uncharacterized protein n=1 Tax=Oceanomicrobium pacificus TaxID=2692916 RepID=A0A6B0TSR4_9RHOB|nr:hypothetical protein [Oceanomicrobium pacificus]MXU65809.1 hypothetical protein [Oceanomicrobium pacificus]
MKTLVTAATLGFVTLAGTSAFAMTNAQLAAQLGVSPTLSVSQLAEIKGVVDSDLRQWEKDQRIDAIVAE